MRLTVQSTYSVALDENGGVLRKTVLHINIEAKFRMLVMMLFEITSFVLLWVRNELLHKRKYYFREQIPSSLKETYPT